MRGRQKGCQKPDRLEGKPQACSPKQIKECHGNVKDHPCVVKPKKKT